jgi:hypothetical protein
MGAGRNLGVFADRIVMIYGAACVENCVGADRAARVDHNASADRRSWANADIGRDHRRWMPGSSEALTLLLQRIEQPAANAVISNCDNQGIVGHQLAISDPTQDGQAEQRSPVQLWVIIQIADRAHFSAEIARSQ